MAKESDKPKAAKKAKLAPKKQSVKKAKKKSADKAKTRPKVSRKEYSAGSHPQNSKRVCVFGAGPMGRAAAVLLSSGGAEVRLWLSEEDKNVDLGLVNTVGVKSTENFEEAIEDCLIFFFAVPANVLVQVVERFAPYSRGYHIAVHGIRGITSDFVLPHQVIRDKTNIKKIAVLGGPLYFDELIAGQMLVAVLASRYNEVFDLIEEEVKDAKILLHNTNDVIGVEIAGAISNVTAIIVGIAEGLGMGDTTKGMLLTRGLSEATTLGVALGASEHTFTGLAGVGDMIPRKVASIDRHVELGRRLVSGETLKNTLETLQGSVEGVETVNAVYKKASELGLELPLMNCIKDLLESKDIEKVAFERISEILKLDLLIGAEAAAISKGIKTT